MSRRRRTGAAPMMRTVQGGRADTGVSQAGRCATINLIDPGGHPLVRFGRYYSDDDPSETWWDSKTLGPTTEFRAEVADDGETWQRLWFRCKTCRDQGRPWVSAVEHDDVVRAVTALWSLGKKSGDTPKRGRLISEPVDVA